MQREQSTNRQFDYAAPGVQPALFETDWRFVGFLSICVIAVLSMLLLDILTPSPRGAANAQTTSPSKLTETEKIEHLLQFVAESRDIVFIRNSEEHACDEAAKHLRRKYDAAKKMQQLTARQFVENIASRSS